MRRRITPIITIIFVMVILSTAVYATNIIYSTKGLSRTYQGSALCESSWMKGIYLGSAQGVTNYGRVLLRDTSGNTLCTGSNQILMTSYTRDLSSGWCQYNSAISYQGVLQWRYFDYSYSSWSDIGDPW